MLPSLTACHLVGLHTLAVSTALAKISCLKGHSQAFTSANTKFIDLPRVLPSAWRMHHCHGAPALLCAEQSVFTWGLWLPLAVKGLIEFWGLWRLLYKKD